MGRAALVAVVGLTLGLAAPLRAQCADGTPPPCEVRARAAPARVQAPAADERGRTFLVLPFRNVTRADDVEWLVEGSPMLLADALSRWQELTVVPTERLYSAMRRHEVTPGEVVDEDRIRRIAEETGGWTAVAGDILATGGRLQVSVRAYDVVTGDVVVRATESADTDDDVREIYDRLGARLLEVAGVGADAPDLSGATTQSLEAYQHYVRGLAHLHRSEYNAAQAALLEAVAIDSTFAQAYLRLAEATTRDLLTLMLPGNPAMRYAQRAQALSSYLPERDRALVRGINEFLGGQLGDARATLEGLLVPDSSDLDAMEWLALLEILDWTLVEQDGRDVIRGSLNQSARLAKRVLTVDPGRHQSYGTLVLAYGLAGGMWLDGWVPAFRGESPSLAAMFMGSSDAMFRVVFDDSARYVSREAAARMTDWDHWYSQRRAAEIGLAWAERWVAAAPQEGEAHLALSRLAELDGDHERALAALDTAQALGVETQLEDPTGRRLVLLGELARYEEGLVVADSLTEAGFFSSFLATSPTNFRVAPWATNLYLLAGRFVGAASVVESYFRATGGGSSYAWEHGALCAARGGGVFLEPDLLPDAFRLEIADSLLGRLTQWPDGEPGWGCAARAVGAALSVSGAADSAGLTDRAYAAVYAVLDTREAEEAVSLLDAVVSYDTLPHARERVAQALGRVLDRYAGDIPTHMRIGRLAMRWRHADEARRAAEPLLEAGLDDSILALASFWAFADTVASSKALRIELMERVLARHPDDIGVQMQVARRSGAVSQDIAQRIAYVMLDAGLPDSANGLAILLVNWDSTAAQWQGAFDLLQAILEAHPDHWGATYQVGKLGAVSGAFLDEAETALRRYLEHDPSGGDPEPAAALWRLGLVLEHKGDVDGARASYEQALRVNPGYEQAREALARLGGTSGT